MSRFFKSRAALLGLVALSAPLAFDAAYADTIKVKLSGTEETPAVTTSAKADGAITIGADKSVSGSITTSGIVGTAAHIHQGAPGQAGPPIITLTKTSDTVWSVPADSKLTDEQYAAYKAGNLYVNIHSADHKPGEIRAQLKP